MNVFELDEIVYDDPVVPSGPIDNTQGVSVILPLYNGIEYLDQAVLSVVNQTHENWELIIGVNGYPPNSEIEQAANDIRSKYKYHKHKIIVRHYTTQGAPLTLNALANDAKYDLVAFLDADDYWATTKLEKQLLYATCYDVIGTHCRYVGNLNFCPSIPLNDVSSHDIFHINPMLHSSILIKKELVQFEDHFVYDYNLWFKLFYEKKRFFNVPDILMYHRVHNRSAYNNSNQNHLEDLKAKWKKIYDERDASGPNET
jgi:glycosyltransferase involved in cell wall biosynthesis